MCFGGKYAGINGIIALFFLAGLFLISAGSAIAQHEGTDISCFHCHSKQVTEFSKSIHFNKNISCEDCHGGEVNITGAAISVNAMNTDFKGVPNRNNITNYCSKCHSEAARLYKESIHWEELQKGRAEAASCIDCHGTHDILSSKNPQSRTYSTNVPLMCAGCHENQTKMSAWYYGIKTDRFDTYKRSFHYKALLSGGKGLATCPDCHENHGTKNETDPASAIYSANLPATCGKAGCHPMQNSHIYGGKVHEGQSVYLLSIDAKKLVTYFYIAMILFELSFTLGLIFFGISSKLEIRRRE
jgi:hypothetical protein